MVGRSLVLSQFNLAQHGDVAGAVDKLVYASSDFDLPSVNFVIPNFCFMSFLDRNGLPVFSLSAM